MPNPAADTSAQDDELNDAPGGPGGDTPAGSAPPSLAASPADVRNSPEYRELQRRFRAEATARGRSDAEAARAREAVAAAEADRAAEQERQIRDVLGDDGVDRWNRISELSSSDPVAAAREFREFAAVMAQSQPAGESGAPGAPTPQGGSAVPPSNANGNTSPQPPQRGVGAGVPLGAQSDDNSWSAVRADSEATFGRIAAKNVDRATRGRVTMRERREGFMAYLGGAIAGAMEERAARRRG